MGRCSSLKALLHPNDIRSLHHHLDWAMASLSQQKQEEMFLSTFNRKCSTHCSTPLMPVRNNCLLLYTDRF